ncbi:MAG TPA: hypothetical protein VHD36_10930 [Pirellulales bacterium]|nr:hypothetical protein [Pirellulales bacterium]
MTLASPAQPVSTDPGGSTNSKQKLYLVAFASLGLLISVQFRHLFARPDVAPAQDNIVTSEQTSPSESDAQADNAVANSNTSPQSTSTAAQSSAPVSTEAPPAESAATDSPGDVLIVERQITIENDADAAPATTDPEQPSSEQSKATPRVDTDSPSNAGAGYAPRNGSPDSVALFFAALRAPEGDVPAATAGDSFSPADLKRFLAFESQAEQGLDAATVEAHHHDGEALARLFAFQAVGDAPAQAVESVPLTDEEIAHWTQFLTQLQNATSRRAADATEAANAAGPSSNDANAAQNESAEASPALATKSDNDSPPAVDGTPNDVPSFQPPAELSAPAAEAPADEGAKSASPTDSATAEELVLANPAESGGTILYLVEGRAFALAPGQEHRLPADRPWRIAFHRGDDFGDTEQVLSNGAFRFVVGSEGWQLIPADNAP